MIVIMFPFNAQLVVMDMKMDKLVISTTANWTAPSHANQGSLFTEIKY